MSLKEKSLSNVMFLTADVGDDIITPLCLPSWSNAT